MQCPLCLLAPWAWVLELMPVSMCAHRSGPASGACTPIYSHWVAASWCPEGAPCHACVLELCTCLILPSASEPGFLPQGPHALQEQLVAELVAEASGC